MFFQERNMHTNYWNCRKDSVIRTKYEMNCVIIHDNLLLGTILSALSLWKVHRHFQLKQFGHCSIKNLIEREEKNFLSAMTRLSFARRLKDRSQEIFLQRNFPTAVFCYNLTQFFLSRYFLNLFSQQKFHLFLSQSFFFLQFVQ